MTKPPAHRIEGQRIEGRLSSTIRSTGSSRMEKGGLVHRRRRIDPPAAPTGLVASIVPAASTGPAASIGPAASTGPVESTGPVASTGLAASTNDNFENDYLSDVDDSHITPEDYYVKPEDDYVEPEDDYFSYSDEDEFDEMAQIIIRGPGYIGDESFDTNCVFGNIVEMNFHQTMQLRSIVEDLPRPPVKEYIVTLTRDNIIVDEGTMEFNPQYTSTYLLQFMMPSIRQSVPARSQVISVAVTTTTSNMKKYYRMRLKNNGNSEIFFGWTKAVKISTCKREMSGCSVSRMRENRFHPAEGILLPG